MQVAFYLAGEITHVKESIPGVRCASGSVFRISYLGARKDLCPDSKMSAIPQKERISLIWPPFNHKNLMSHTIRPADMCGVASYQFSTVCHLSAHYSEATQLHSGK